MAKFKYNQNIEGDIGFDGALDLKVKKNGEVALWTDDVTGAQIKAEGTGFEISGENEDYLSAGKIKSVLVTDDDGKTVLAISDLNVKAVKLMSAFEEGGTSGVLQFITLGDDQVVGSNKSDYLVGGAGDDVMTGGKGSDYFEFHEQIPMKNGKPAPEENVITDFDWKGEDADQLQYLGEGYEFKGVHKGEDTLITFANESTLLLEGVKKAQFQQWLDTPTDM